MRQIMNSRIVLLLVCCFGLHFSASADIHRMSLKEAIDKNLVILKSAVANGKGSGSKGIELSLVNITCNDIVVDINPVIFRSKAAGAPEMVLAGNESINLPHEKVMKVSPATYFISNDARDPVAGEKYRMYKCDETLVKLLAYINANHINSKLAQKAILSVTDGAAMATVYDARRPNTSKKLQRFLASALNASRSQANTNKYAAYRPPPVVDTKLFVNLDMNFKNARNLRVTIHDAEGFVYPRLVDVKQREYISESSHTVDIEVDTARMPHGTYTVSICDDTNKTWSQKVITV